MYIVFPSYVLSQISSYLKYVYGYFRDVPLGNNLSRNFREARTCLLRWTNARLRYVYGPDLTKLEVVFLS